MDRTERTSPERAPDDGATTDATASDLLLAALVDRGIEYLFCNLGTDHAPLIEAIARWRLAGRRLPTLVVCPHENTAVHMAGGYAAATGRGQAVLVHVDAGTANAAMALHNLFRARLPVLLIAGRAPATTYGAVDGGRDTYVHFVQEPFDQASVVRPYVKWEYTLPWPSMAAEVVTRADSVMQSDPRGPVYLMLPREMLAAPVDPAEVGALPAARHAPVSRGPGDAGRIGRIAERLITSDDPLLVTAYAGREHDAPALIERLADLAGIRVCEFNAVYLNVRRDAPCFAGYQPGPYAETADFGLLVDVDVPWIPRTTRVNPDAFWGQFDVDAIKQDLPMWSFACDERIEGHAPTLLRQLIDAVESLADDGFRERAAARRAAHAAEYSAREARANARASILGHVDAIDPHALCAALGRALHPHDIVLNEAIRNTLAVFEQIPRTEPGTLFGLPGGGLGFSAGMALGLKLARPDAAVVHVVGDGTFYFGNPSAVYAVSRQYRLPILTVVLDNGGWSAVKEATLRMYPDGHAKASDDFVARLPQDMDFAAIVEAAGGHGERLTDPADIDAAIGRALAAVRGGRSALVHARVTAL